MFKNEDFKIAYDHLQLSIDESEKNTKKILEILYSMSKDINEGNFKDLENKIVKATELLQFQDIISQRLKKVQNFLKEIDSLIDSQIDKEKLSDFAWENEVEQNDVDDILKSYGL
ncbi:hypothetical protein [Nitrosophilus kaiyonis]|uniref:hypothetical protein n=1 Tax=Nitrosophilus kaiyonis TaxID=2930200 RepID=UPI0024931BCB|nr:hypothetical protein [Nitrosophilus kaiyonis]